MTDISLDLARRYVAYDPSTGRFTWLPRDAEDFAGFRGPEARAARWNAEVAGTEAFTSFTATGYRQGQVAGFKVSVHRLAFAMSAGRYPSETVDHINGDRADNRAANLREATRGEQSRNTASRRGSSSKHLGVSWDSRDRKWKAAIQSNGKKRTIGYFVSEEEAAAAYAKAAIETHGEFTRASKQSEAA